MLTIPGYTTTEQLYESGHSLIFRGRRNADDLPIVLKLLKNEYPTREEIARFKREYEITRNLNRSTGLGQAVDGVIGVYAMERYKGRLVMVLEDFGGESLTRYLADQALEVTKFLRLAIQISDILGKIHQRNVMHKDINPSNIIWNPDTAQLKIIDFGISTELSREQPEIRNPNVLEGTLAYMSPEQTGRMNRAMDYRTDLYSLGVTYYRLLTGQLPFQTTDAMELIHCHLAQHPVPLNEINQDIPKPVSDIIMKLMAKTAEDRYQGTFGLKADLQMCLAQLQTFEVSKTSKVFIKPFEIGQKDISDRFQIPQRLYGREQEIETMLEAFERVNTPLNPPSRGEGATEMIAITGPPGIGKSVLIHEILPAVVEKHGYFVSGKFEQLTQNIPYSAFIQAFRELIDYILAESEIQINLWKERLLKALGANGQIIIEVIPEVELIIGPQPELPELSPDKAQNRFHLTFRSFVRTFATAEHPLVIFLDDAQWADLPSLKLITLFMTDTAISSLLLVCAYRNNEINGAHPLQSMLIEIQNTSAIVNTITLKPLTLKDVNQLLVDTLHITHPSPSQEGKTPPYTPLKGGIPPDPSYEGSLLAELLLQKTGGNPFFLLQFLQSLHEERLLEFNDRHGVWEWKLEQIQKAEITDNVVNLMAGKIQKLPEATQRTLEFAACIGNQFDLETLATITERAKTEIVYDVWKALQEGLIVQLDDSYSHVEIIDSHLPTTDLSESCPEGSQEENRRIPVITGNPHFKFLHTRVRQAAYSLMAEDHKHTAHVEIGRLILDRTPKRELEEKIFEIVNHFNLGKDLITSQSEKDKLAEINLIAGKKAKASTAYQPAYEYLKNGIVLLSKESWQHQYDVTLALFSESAEAAYLSGDFKQMEALVSTVLQQAHTLSDKVHAHEARIQAYIAQNRPLEAIKNTITVMKQFGIKIPENPGKLRALFSLIDTKLLLTGKSIEHLVNLPKGTEPSQLVAMRLMAITGSPAYYALPDLVPLLVFKGIKLSVKYGNRSFSAYGYAGYGLILCGVLGDIESGYRFGKLALNVLERFKAEDQKARVFHVVYTCITHWKEHFKNALQPLLEGYRSGLETGDIEFGCYATATYCYLSFLTGKELTELEQEIAEFIETVSKLKQEIPLNCLKIYYQAVLHLLEHIEDPAYIPDRSDDEKSWIKALLDADDKHAVFQFYFTKLLLCYLLRAYPHAIEHADLAEQYLDGAVGLPCIPLYYFYDSLTRLAIYPDAPRLHRNRLLKRVAANQRKMKKWARHAPMNHLHRWYLVEAERARVLENDAEAIEHYDKAIELAREHDYLNDEALANELAADFYFAKGKRKLTEAYIRDARYAYFRWGAIAKVQDIDQRYPKLAAMQRRRGDLSHTLTRVVTTSTTTDGTSTHLLDLSTMMKASQAISGEIVLERLLKQLMAIVIENAGAQKGILILEESGKLLVEAKGTIEKIQEEQSLSLQVLQSIPVETSQEISLAIVNYVVKTQNYVVLQDAAQEGRFPRDPYITRKQPKSILCTPIVHRGNLIGVLYLENNLIAGAFTPDRLELLQMLSSQAAISLENARLYTDLQHYNLNLEVTVAERTAELREKNVQLQAVNASKDKFFSIISHDLRSPFVTLLGYTQLMIENFEAYTPEKLKQNLGKLRESAERLYALLENLLTWSRIQRGVVEHNPKTINIRGIVEENIALFRSKAEQKQVTLISSIQENISVYADYNMMDTVIRNLISNALKFTEAGGTIEISVQRDDEQYVEVAVADTGTGISEEGMAKLFRIDVQYTNVGTDGEGGTGLGLILCQDLVEKNGGRIWVESELGKGTTFRFTVPQKPEE